LDHRQLRPTGVNAGDAELHDVSFKEEVHRPIHNYSNPARPAWHLGKVDSAEQPPGYKTGDLDPKYFRDGGPASERGKRANRVVYEGLRPFLFNRADDILSNMRAFANRVLSGRPVALSAA